MYSRPKASKSPVKVAAELSPPLIGRFAPIEISQMGSGEALKKFSSPRRELRASRIGF